MILTVRIPRFALLVALRSAGRAPDAPVALGPQPGDPQLVGLCTPAADACGVRPGLRVGEALARCPDLELVVPDPGACDQALEFVTERLEAVGAAVEVVDAGTWRFATAGLERLHGGIAGIVRRVKGVLPVGMHGRIGVAPTPFASLLAAEDADPRSPRILEEDEVRPFLAPFPVERLPLDPPARAELARMGITTVGRLAELPRTAVVDRFGLDGLRAWNCAHGLDGERLRPRTPPEPIEAAFHFPEAVGTLATLHAAARLLIGEVAATAGRRGNAVRTVMLRAWLDGGGSWARTVTLREATAEPERLAVATLPCLEEVGGPVETLVVRVDASGICGGRQLTLTSAGAAERARRAGEAVNQIRSAHGDEAVLRLVELEPWSRLPERQWALVPFDGSISPDHFA